MFEKLIDLEDRFKIIEEELSKPETVSNREKYLTLSKEHSNLAPIVEKFDAYTSIKKNLNDAETEREVNADPEMHELLADEIKECKEKLENIENELKVALLPKDPNDDKNVVIEIRPAAGGEEAALFAARLVRMYTRYAERNRWGVEFVEESYTELGGVKEVVFTLNGYGAYSKLKFESGVHRVQRVPETESQGRVHTSTATVAVLPEVEDVEIEIEEKDLKIDTYRSGGAGGQHVNKTESAIRITHLPTGLVVTCEDERSQGRNKDKAMKVLKSRLYDHYQSIATKEYSDNRKMQVGTGDRSERIRTYNFPQGRVTDHRIGFTVYSIDAFMDGDLTEMIDKLTIEDQNLKLSKSSD